MTDNTVNLRKSKTITARYASLVRYFKYFEKTVTRRRCRHKCTTAKVSLLGGALLGDDEKIPFCYYVARVVELLQEERKAEEAIEGLFFIAYNALDPKGRSRISATRAEQTEKYIRRYYDT